MLSDFFSFVSICFSFILKYKVYVYSSLICFNFFIYFFEKKFSNHCLIGVFFAPFFVSLLYLDLYISIFIYCLFVYNFFIKRRHNYINDIKINTLFVSGLLFSGIFSSFNNIIITTLICELVFYFMFIEKLNTKKFIYLFNYFLSFLYIFSAICLNFSKNSIVLNVVSFLFLIASFVKILNIYNPLLMGKNKNLLFILYCLISPMYFVFMNLFKFVMHFKTTSLFFIEPFIFVFTLFLMIFGSYKIYRNKSLIDFAIGSKFSLFGGLGLLLNKSILENEIFYEKFLFIANVQMIILICLYFALLFFFRAIKIKSFEVDFSKYLKGILNENKLFFYVLILCFSSLVKIFPFTIGFYSFCSIIDMILNLGIYKYFIFVGIFISLLFEVGFFSKIIVYMIFSRKKYDLSFFCSKWVEYFFYFIIAISIFHITLLSNKF